MSIKRFVTVITVVCCTLIMMSCMFVNKVSLQSISVEDGATGVFNYRPIKVTFSAPPKNVDIRLNPSVEGRVVAEGNEVVFFPQEKFAPNTTYTLSIAWNDGGHEISFVSINEIAQLYYTDFTEYELGQLPVDWMPFAAKDAADFKVVELEAASGGRALLGFDGGSENAHLVMPAVSLSENTSDILVELTVWLSKGEFTGVYLWDAKPTWPPYASVADVGKYFADEELRAYRFATLFRLDDGEADVYVNDEVQMSNVGFRNTPAADLVDYTVGLFFNGNGNSTDVYWGDARISEVGK
ncbi:MAG: Ig-like domain-containing protein [Limnochordia bacterium]|jgi:hypothetical protein|nr:Ig-like domain-containing protein [Limnochordia bacterium]